MVLCGSGDRARGDGVSEVVRACSAAGTKRRADNLRSACRRPDNMSTDSIQEPLCSAHRDRDLPEWVIDRAWYRLSYNGNRQINGAVQCLPQGQRRRWDGSTSHPRAQTRGVISTAMDTDRSLILTPHPQRSGDGWQFAGAPVVSSTFVGRLRTSIPMNHHAARDTQSGRGNPSSRARSAGPHCAGRRKLT